jgi:hypothetical protein
LQQQGLPPKPKKAYYKRETASSKLYEMAKARLAVRHPQK